MRFSVPLAAAVAAQISAVTAATSTTSSSSATKTSSGSSSVVSVFLGGSQDSSAQFAASIISACGDNTVFALQCTAAESDGACGTDAPVLTATVGPSLFLWTTTTSTTTQNGIFTLYMSESCALKGTTEADCSVSYATSVSLSGQVQTTNMATTTKLTGTDYFRNAVTVTAGASNTGACKANAGAAARPGSVLAVGSVALAMGMIGVLAL